MRVTAHDTFAVRAEGHTRDTPVVAEGQHGVTIEGTYLLPGLHIPNLQRPVATTAHEAFPVRAKGHAQDTTTVPLEEQGLRMRLRIQHFQLPIAVNGKP